MSAVPIRTATDDILSACRLLFLKGQTVEVRAINVPKRGTVSGYFNNGAALAAAAASLSGVAESVYITLNPLNPDLQARANNRLQDYSKNTAGDKDIIIRRWLPIDFDAIRPSGISSTDKEHDAALERAAQAVEFLTAKGWPEPITADSGNGAHLLYRIDLPNDDDSLQLVKSVLKALADHLSDDLIKLDTSVCNAARIWKLYGTMACKGDDMPDRPHRLARVLSAPAVPEVVTVDQLRAMVPAQSEPVKPVQQATRSFTGQQTFSLEDWINGHGIETRGPYDHQGGRKWILPVCPFNQEHNRGEAMLGETPSGAAYFKCQHDSCSGYGWADYRAIYDGVKPVRSANDNRPVVKPAAVPAVQAQSVPAVIDYMSPLIMLNGKGKPLATIENLVEICSRLNVTIRYNVIKKEDEILIPGQSFSVDNQANASLAWLRSECVKFGYPTDALGDYASVIADNNLFNPVASWITSKPWDGKTRLPELYATIKSEDEQLKETLLKRWLLSAIAAVVEPDGVSAHGVLVLQGDQYLGKTKWFKSLVPAHLDVVQDGHLLRVDDKDNVRQACSNWLVELGELDATFRKSDIAALKSFITKKKDVMRRAYAKKDSHFARRTVFFGSVNPKQFLHDTSGNRRYWTVECKHIDHSHNVDMQQMWAEVFAIYQTGERHYLLPDEMARLNRNNEEFSVSDPVVERIQTRLDWSASEYEWAYKSATEILVSIGVDRPTQGDLTKASQTLREMNGGKTRRSNTARLLFVPPLARMGGWTS